MIQANLLTSKTQKIMASKFTHNFFMQFLSWQRDPELAKYFDGKLGRVVTRFKVAIMSGQKKGDFFNKNPDSLAYFLAGVFYGLQVVKGDTSLNQNELKKIISNAITDLD